VENSSHFLARSLHGWRNRWRGASRYLQQNFMSPRAQHSAAGPPARTLRMGMRTVLTRRRASHQPHQLATTTASGSAIRKSTSHNHGQRRAHLPRLQPRHAAGPQKGQEGPPTVSPRERHPPPLQQPTEDEQGATGGLARRASGTHPHKTRPKTGNWALGLQSTSSPALFCEVPVRPGRCSAVAGSGGLPWVFGLLPVERSEWGLGGGVARAVVLHLCMKKCLIGKARPVAPTELQSEGAVSPLGVHS